MENILELVRQRRSVRSFDGRRLTQEDLTALLDYAHRIKNPYGIPLEFRILDASEHTLKCPVVTGTEQFLGIKIQCVPHMEEAFGYTVEELILFAQSRGIGTVWVGGTMDRSGFEHALSLKEDERMLCMLPIGYPAKKMSLRETMMRKGVKADSRVPFGEVFFDGSFAAPLTPEKAGRFADALEAVRLAPSAVNRQPWRIVMTDSGAHFYEKHSKGYLSERNGDMQKIDLGIALSHFFLQASAQSLHLQFSTETPGIPTEADTEYIASYRFN